MKDVIEWERQKVEHLLNSVMNVLRMQTFAKNISYVTVTDKGISILTLHTLHHHVNYIDHENIT